MTQRGRVTVITSPNRLDSVALNLTIVKRARVEDRKSDKIRVAYSGDAQVCPSIAIRIAPRSC